MNRNQVENDYGALTQQAKFDREAVERAEAVLEERKAALAASELRAAAFAAEHGL